MRMILAAVLVVSLAACSAGEPGAGPTAPPRPAVRPAVLEPAVLEPEEGEPVTESTTPATKQMATFGAGCYWCVEAVLEQLDGVFDARSGFMGGHVQDPSYEAVRSGVTGHAEVVQVDFDPSKISYDTLLAWFWKLHDPTTLNKQGGDFGTQYRSAIYYHSEAQKAAAEKSKAAADASGDFRNPIVTEVTAASDFYEAKQDHQDFYRENKQYGYCRAVITPKMKKLGLAK